MVKVAMRIPKDTCTRADIVIGETLTAMRLEGLMTVPDLLQAYQDQFSGESDLQM